MASTHKGEGLRCEHACNTAKLAIICHNVTETSSRVSSDSWTAPPHLTKMLPARDLQVYQTGTSVVA